MLASAIPYKFTAPWASSAAGNMINNPIPATASGGNASQVLGYPPITAAPVGSGGIPPNVADENGAHYYETLWLQWIQAGGPIPYDATFSTNIGGYPSGAIIQSTAGTYHWQSTADNNTTNPNSGGANWIRYEGGSFPRRFASQGVNNTWTGASVGTLVAIGGGATTQTINSATFVAGDTIGFSTSFSCVITLSSGVFVGGSASGATSITLPVQSWMAFQFDGTNWRIFSQSASADIGTLGGVLSGTLPNPGMASGAAATNVGTLGGDLNGSTLPNPTIKSSVALGGNPTTTTQASGDSSTKIANTAFVNPASSIANPGYRTEPDGLVVQWGTTSVLAHNASQTIALPTPFSVGGFVISATPIVSAGSENGQSASAQFVNTGTITVSNTGATGGISFGIYWEAKGK